MKNKAFTIAETLIALVIIGIVAALTVPILVNKYRNHQFEITLKKAYSELSQVENQILLENGGTDPAYDLYQTGNLDKTKMGEYCDKYWSPKIKYLKKCSNAGQCGYKISNQPFLNPDKTYYGQHIGNHGCGYILQDGKMLDITYGRDGLAYSVDLNGPKGPNIVGLDYFIFEYTKYGFKPQGYFVHKGWGNGLWCSNAYCNKTSGGWCAYYVLVCSNGKITY